MPQEAVDVARSDVAAARVLDTAIDAILVANESGVIVLANAQAEQLFGYPREQILGLPLDQLVPAGEAADARARRRDGTDFPVDVTISRLRSRHGSLVCAAVHDLSAKRREERLFRGLLEAAPDAMVIVDHNGCIVLTNAQVERLFGYRREELVGRGVEVLVPGRFAGAHRAFRSGYVAEPRTRPMGLAGDLFARRKDGSEFPVEISLAPLETDEGLLVSAAVRDISQRRRVEEEANRVKDEFFATVSHELRTPLTSMIGYAEIMAELEDLSPYGRRFLSVIRRSAERELRLVDDLLTIAAIEDSGLSVQVGELDLESVVREAVEAVRPAAEEASLELSLQTPGFAVPTRGDKDRLGQALDNLLSNAVKFSRPGGAIRVALRLVGSHVEIDVTDSGPGIGDVDPERLFERMYRSREAVRQQVPGAGLGLPIALAIVEAHHGTITVPDSGPDGTTFRVLLPA
jgi:protein-histidine pros-kinase